MSEIDKAPSGSAQTDSVGASAERLGDQWATGLYPVRLEIMAAALREGAREVEAERKPDEEPDIGDLDEGYEAGLRDAAQIVRDLAARLTGE